jgi:hypothetical protein
MGVELIDSKLPQLNAVEALGVSLPSLGGQVPEADPKPQATPVYAGAVAKLGNPFKRKNGGK